MKIRRRSLCGPRGLALALAPSNLHRVLTTRTRMMNLRVQPAHHQLARQPRVGLHLHGVHRQLGLGGQARVHNLSHQLQPRHYLHRQASPNQARLGPSLASALQSQLFSQLQLVFGSFASGSSRDMQRSMVPGGQACTTNSMASATLSLMPPRMPGTRMQARCVHLCRTRRDLTRQSLPRCHPCPSQLASQNPCVPQVSRHLSLQPPPQPNLPHLLLPQSDHRPSSCLSLA